MTADDTWIFGYGSLAVRPPPLVPPAGVSLEALIEHPVERRPAFVVDWTRRLWQGSPDHRGTPTQPGRVATMLRWPGRRCVGVAYRIPVAVADATLAALDARERAGYERVTVPVFERDGDAPFAEAVTWVAPTSNPHFLGLASPHAMAAQIAAAAGPSGSNRDYVLELAAALLQLGESTSDEVFEVARLVERG